MNDAYARAGNVHGLLLYDYAGSPCARRVRITLLEKGLVWDTQVVDLSRLEQRNPAYLALNPNGFVPTLAHGERVVYESNVITRYLDDAFPERPLYPDDAAALTEVQAWQAAELALAKDYRPLLYQRLMGPVLRLTRTLDEALDAARRSTVDASDLAWEERVWRLEVLTPDEERATEARLVDWLARLEQRLAGRDFLVGAGAGRFGQAEISVYPRVAMLPYVGVAIPPARYPHVARWMTRLAARPSFARTLSPQDRGLIRLARTGILPWLGRTVRKPEGERGLAERAGLAALRRVLLLATGDPARESAPAPQPAHAQVAPSASAQDAAPAPSQRPIRLPARGAVVPETRPTRALAPLPRERLADPITLWDARHSPHGRRIRIQLAFLGIPAARVERIELDLARMEHRAPAYLAIHPEGEVPALRHGERVLVDSAAIAEYLDHAFGADTVAPLLPRDAWRAAQVRMWLALEVGTHKEFRPLFWLHVVRPELARRGLTPENVADAVPPGVHPSHVAWLRDVLRGRPRFDSSEPMARARVRAKLDVLERRLREGEHLVDGGLSLADLAWWTRVALLPRLGIALDAERHAALLRWQRRLAAHPAFAADPETDAPDPEAHAPPRGAAGVARTPAHAAAGSSGGAPLR